MRVERIRIKRAMRGEDGAAWARALADPSWSASATVLKDEPGSSWVRRATINGREVVVKCRFLNTRSRRLKAALGYGHGDKHWRGAAVLASKGIATARPIVHASAYVDGAVADVLVLAHLDGPTVLELMDCIRRGGGPPVRQQHAIAAAVGETVPALLRAGLWNRDHKPSNLIVTGLIAGRPEVAIIDCVGLKRYGCLGIDGMEGEMMCASLLIEPTGLACRPRGALRMRALRTWLGSDGAGSARTERHAALRVLIDEISLIVAAHGDPRPRVDPLAGRR